MAMESNEVVERGQENVIGTAESVAGSATPRSLALAKEGVKTGGQFAALMSALMSDVIEGSLSPQVSNAAVNAGGKLLKVVELQYKFGSPKPDSPSGERYLPLTN